MLMLWSYGCDVSFLYTTTLVVKPVNVSDGKYKSIQQKITNKFYYKNNVRPDQGKKEQSIDVSVATAPPPPMKNKF